MGLFISTISIKDQDKNSLEFSNDCEPNLDQELVNKFAKSIGLKFSKDETTSIDHFSPRDLFDYIYAVLYSPSYRKKYKAFLKIDFPRIPNPKDAKQFRQLAEKGRELRQIHLMESPILNKMITTYPVEGSDIVEKWEFSADRVYINEKQYFGNVSEVTWNFWIGGYQPAQKWLKDRKGRKLSNEDIEHYQKIIIALVETDRLMKEIDEV